MSHRLNAELKKRVRMDRSAEGWPKPTNLQELEERIPFEVGVPPHPSGDQARLHAGDGPPRGRVHRQRRPRHHQVACEVN